MSPLLSAIRGGKDTEIPIPHHHRPNRYMLHGALRQRLFTDGLAAIQRTPVGPLG